MCGFAFKSVAPLTCFRGCQAEQWAYTVYFSPFHILSSIFHPYFIHISSIFHPYFIHISFIFHSRIIHIIHDALIITLHPAFTFSCCVCRKIVCIGPAEAAKQRLSPHKNSFKHLTTRPVIREGPFMILSG